MPPFYRWIGIFLATFIIILLPACSTIPDQVPEKPPDAVIEVDPDPLEPIIKQLSRDQESTTTNPHQSLIKALAERFKQPEQFIAQVVLLVDELTDGTYPSLEAVLAIIAIESSFNPRASYRGSKGLMQIHMPSHRKAFKGASPYQVRRNVEIGIGILRQYHQKLGKERSAVLAYNAGIGNFSKGRYSSDYFRKYKRELAFVRSIR